MRYQDVRLLHATINGKPVDAVVTLPRRAAAHLLTLGLAEVVEAAAEPEATGGRRPVAQHGETAAAAPPEARASKR